jgi:UDPglucose--hexose-1-phosphate uridylyltransferase
VRVVPNKFPVLQGMNEVVVHSPSHELGLADLPVEHVAEVLAAYQRRIAAQCGAGAAAVLPIMNHGRGAGASLSHPHSQIFATAIVPPLLVDELALFADYRTKYDRCLLCDVLGTVRDQKVRLVLDGPVAAFAPEASRWPYELWLAPAEHQPEFGEAAVSAVAGALRRALTALTAVTGDAPHNFWVHTRPCASDGPFHWHIELVARLATPAGFELGSGLAVDHVDPERAAAALRAALPPA